MKLDTNNAEYDLVGGSYVVGTSLNGGTADLQFQYQNGNTWYSVGTLEDGKGQMVGLPGFKVKVRLVKSGNAFVELARSM